MQNRTFVQGRVIVELSDRIPRSVDWEKTPLTGASRRFQQAIVAGLDLSEEAPDHEFIQKLLAHPEIVDDRTVVFQWTGTGPQVCYRAPAARDPQIHSFTRLIRTHDLAKPTVFGNGSETALFQTFGDYIVVVWEGGEK